MPSKTKTAPRYSLSPKKASKKSASKKSAKKMMKPKKVGMKKSKAKPVGSTARCGKRANAFFPFTTDEMKEKLLKNRGRLITPKMAGEIRKMKRLALCKYFATKNGGRLAFNTKMVHKVGHVHQKSRSKAY